MEPTDSRTDGRSQIHLSLSERSVTPLDARLEADNSSSHSSTTLSDPETVIRWQTPPSRRHTPQQPSDETLRSQNAFSSRSESTVRPDAYSHSIGANEVAFASDKSLVVRFAEEHIRSTEASASKRDERMDASSAETSPPTPVDDTPYIRFAIDQLTRDQDVQSGWRHTPRASSESCPAERIVADHSPRYMSADQEREAMRLIRKHRSSPAEGRLFAFNATRPLSPLFRPDHVNTPSSPRRPSDTEVFIPVDLPPNNLAPELTFVPTILRPLSMITLSCLCLLMIAALMFGAIYATHHDGLTDWAAGIYGPRYFVFAFLPQILAACLFLYVQCVMAAMTRIMPFTLMAMGDVSRRTNALFLGMFPRSMLWPRWTGSASINIANVFFWLSVFTIPLQGCLFSVTLVDDRFVWTTVQGVAWTLFAIYLLILVAAGITGFFFFRRTTGVMWDPRSLADVIALLPSSNSLRDYAGTDVMRNREDLRHRLADRSDRLGYWKTPNKDHGIFYCVGEEGASTRQYTLQAGKLTEKPRTVFDIEKAELYSTGTRFRHLPWFLRDACVVLWAVVGFFLLLALVVVSFLPSTAIRKGLPPLVPVLPNLAGFSPANFLYSFVPSIIGMLLYLFFQPIDMALRKLQPWAELGKPAGANAQNSLLLDYPACFPFSCSTKAFANGHYRVAILSFLSTLFLLIPVLAGGLFFPLTTPANVVRMIPNLPSFYILLTLLALYLVALLLLIPRRYEMRLPHDIDCLAEIFSFVHGSQILADPAFQRPKSKADLETRLTGARNGWPPSVRGDRNRFAFGIYRGRAGGECLGIERLGRRGAQEVVILNAR